MSISDEQLIAYLLDDLQPTERAAVDAELRGNPAATQRLAELRELLGIIDTLGDQPHEPPSDLVDSTMLHIEQLGLPFASEPEQPAATPSAGEAVAADGRGRGWVSPASLIGSSRGSLADSLALTLSLAVLCSLALPAMIRARFEARKAQCVLNLKSTGCGLFNFAAIDPEQRLPRLALSGPESFAGVYAVRLHEAGMLRSGSQLQCPSLIGTGRDRAFAVTRLRGSRDLYRIAARELPAWQNRLGGDYAYNLGVLEDGRTESPQHLGRTHFAILADAPKVYGPIDRFDAHDGRGINILYGDGSIRFLTTESLQQLSDERADEPFHNLNGEHRVGLDLDDAVLAPSHFPPLNP